MPATVEKVRVFLGVDPATSVDTEALGYAVAAGNTVVMRLRPDWTGGVPPVGEHFLTAAEAEALFSKLGHKHGLAFGETAADGTAPASFDAQVPRAVGDWYADAEQAAVLLSARFYGRRGSIQGVAAFADLGVTMLGRLDPDVRLLLQLGEFQPSVVA